jgi:hypothetical protein
MIMTASKAFALGFGLLLASAPFLPSAKADEWNKETKITFDNPVEVPGRVLLPGTYVFKLADSPTERQLVEIYNDNDRLVTTVLAVPDYRLQPSNTTVTFSEGRKGSPESIHEWFYPAENDGVEFVYRTK